MDESAAALNRIAEILERTPTTDFLSTVSPVTTFLLGIFTAVVGAVVTYIVRKRLQREQLEHTKQEQLNKQRKERRLLVSLLGDEIALRWDGWRERHLQPVFGQFSRENAQTLCAKKIQLDDFPVFQKCATDLSRTAAFNDPTFVSDVIYAHIAIRDFCDGLSTLRQQCAMRASANTLGASEDASGEDARSSSDAEVRETWTSLKNAHEIIDSQMHKIFLYIEQEYNEFIDSNQETLIPTFEVRVRIKLAAQRRRRKPSI